MIHELNRSRAAWEDLMDKIRSLSLIGDDEKDQWDDIELAFLRLQQADDQLLAAIAACQVAS